MVFFSKKLDQLSNLTQLGYDMNFIELLEYDWPPIFKNHIIGWVGRLYHMIYLSTINDLKLLLILTNTSNILKIQYRECFKGLSLFLSGDLLALTSIIDLWMASSTLYLISSTLFFLFKDLRTASSVSKNFSNSFDKS